MTCISSKFFSKSTKLICTQDWCSMDQLSPIFLKKQHETRFWTSNAQFPCILTYFAYSWCHKQVFFDCTSSKLFFKSKKKTICTQDWYSMGHPSPMFLKKNSIKHDFDPSKLNFLTLWVFVQLPGLKINIRWLLNHPSCLLNQQN